MKYFTITIRAVSESSERFYPKRLTSVNTHVDTTTAESTTHGRQPARQEQLGLSV